MSLFNYYTYTKRLSSGKLSLYKIDCDELSERDLEAVAAIMSKEVGAFGSVEGVPTGGLRLAEKFKKYVCHEHFAKDIVLIVDDVLTTGASMERQRAGRMGAKGVVIFSRTAITGWVKPMFTMNIEA